MPSNNHTESESQPQLPPKKGFFFNDDSIKHIERFYGDKDTINDIIRYGNTKYLREFKDTIESFISHEKEKGAAKHVIELGIRKNITQRIDELRKSMNKEETAPEIIEEEVQKTFQKMNQIVSEIIKNGWLQGLKDKCEAIISNEEKKGTPQKEIVKRFGETIKYQINALMKNSGNSGEEIDQMAKDLFKEAAEIIRPLLQKKQESQQEIPLEDRWVQSLKKECEAIISDEKKKETAPNDIDVKVNNYIDLQIAGLQQSMEENNASPQYIEDEINKILPKIEDVLIQLQSERQETSIKEDLHAMRIPINHTERDLTPPSPASPPSLLRGKSV